MKTLLTLLAALTLTMPARAVRAQTSPTAHATTPTKTADQRAATYKGPKVVKDSKALGRQMVQKSKPTDSRVPIFPRPR